MDATIEQAILDYVDIPQEIRDLARLANYDLYFGPLAAEEIAEEDKKVWRGFQNACDVISRWASENVSTLYVEVDAAYVTDSEPQGYWIDAAEVDIDANDLPDGETEIYIEPPEYYEFERKDVLKILFGKELTDCVW